MSTTLGFDEGELFVQEGPIYIGKFTNAALVGVDDVDVMERFEAIGQLGQIARGTIAMDTPREFAEAISGTPGIVTGRRMVLKRATLKAELMQINSDLWKYCWSLKTKRNHQTNGPDGLKIHNYAWIGPNEPKQCYYGLVFLTKLENGHPVRVIFWYAQNTSSALTLRFPGTNYGSYPIEFQAFPEPTIMATPDGDQSAYAIIDEIVDNSEDIC